MRRQFFYNAPASYDYHRKVFELFTQSEDDHIT